MGDKKRIYPKAGPRKGQRILSVLGAARHSTLLTSAIEPAPTANTGENASPAKNRSIHSVQIFCEKPAPMVKRAAMGVETR